MSDLPFIPIPEVGTDPNSGTTLGLLPVFLTTDADHQVRRVIAPDIIRSSDFGFGARGRIFDYPSEDTQWYGVIGAKQRVERELDALYSTGLTRQGDWSASTRIVYDRSGSARFFGLGNRTSLDAQTNYTNEQAYVEAQIGFNLSHAWQLAYIARPRLVEVEPGSLHGVTSIEQSFPRLRGLDTTHELFNRFQVSYDTRDSLTVPRHGLQLVGLVGISDRSLASSTSYTVASVDFRSYSPIGEKTTLALHTALRYMPTGGSEAPFWALSSLGGDRSVIGEQQPLRGYGEDRFVDRNLFAASVELRREVLSLRLFSTDLILELAPFIDTGQVFSRLGDNPVNHLHAVGGMGFRAVASPFLVGYVDVGYGSEGTAVFSGISYPF
ncbi:MAG TPA: BamA/TamA family outer membrane protein [Aliidongia sp.]|nr:BamA/TamA family outer membrane protein [Aliidongia sp.]